MKRVVFFLVVFGCINLFVVSQLVSMEETQDFSSELVIYIANQKAANLLNDIMNVGGTKEFKSFTAATVYEPYKSGCFGCWTKLKVEPEQFCKDSKPVESLYSLITSQGSLELYENKPRILMGLLFFLKAQNNSSKEDIEKIGQQELVTWVNPIQETDSIIEKLKKLDEENSWKNGYGKMVYKFGASSCYAASNGTILPKTHLSQNYGKKK